MTHLLLLDQILMENGVASKLLKEFENNSVCKVKVTIAGNYYIIPMASASDIPRLWM